MHTGHSVTILYNTETVVSVNEEYLEDDRNQSGKDISNVKEHFLKLIVI